jgi:hypothetical protein
MKEKIDELIGKVMRLIAESAQNNHVIKVGQLSAIAQRLTELREVAFDLEEETQKYHDAIKDLSKNASPINIDLGLALDGLQERRESRQKLKVEIDWKWAGKSRDVETVREHTGSETMRRTMELLERELGFAALEKLTQLRVSRGPLVSKNPEVDFRNRASGTAYAYLAIGRTPFFVLTNTSTPEKVGHVNLIAKQLGLPEAFLRASLEKY